MKKSAKETPQMSSRVVTVITQIMVMAVVISVILLFIGIGILIFIHLCIVGSAFRRNLTARRRSVVSSVVINGNNDNNGGMSEEEVQKLPSFVYNKHGREGMFVIEECYSNIFDCTECAVCLDGFQRGDKCRLLPVCRHCFHAKCVDAWLYKNPMCPICRTSAEVQHGGEDVKEGLELLGRGADCELGRVNRDFAIGVPARGGGGGGSGFYHVSDMPNPPPLPSRSPSSTSE